MANMRIRLPELAEPLQLPLQPGQALLLGREPSVARLDGELQQALQGAVPQPVPLYSPRVSANHLLIWHAPDAIYAWDLGSRNGSWLRMLPSQRFAIAGSPDLTFELAIVESKAPPLGELKDAEWSTEKEYPTAVLRAVSDWLRHTGLALLVSLTSAPRSDSDADSIPLADGSLLLVAQPRELTFEMSWQLAIDRIRAYVNEQNIRYEQFQGHDEDFVLVSAPLRAAHHALVDAAAYGMRVMLLGPTGTGKERLARCYHNHSRQHRGPYTTVNCALLRDSLLYAQLFGAKKGSYTGSVTDVVGVLEAAHEGTLFLDEVGDMDMEVQKALLRFLDSRGEYYRLGESQARRANVQIVCATNAPLDNPAQRHGKFRDDLWYRLAVKVVRVPPLSERRDDILAFLQTRALRGGQIKAIDALTPAALQLVLQDPWPGNFRDLENFLERLPATAQPRTIDEARCAAVLREGRGPSAPAKDGGAAPIATPPLGNSNWQEISAVAFSAFAADYGDVPKNWGQLQIYMEKYLKPVFVAKSCALDQVNELHKTVNYSELARHLNIADGSTVKMHLGRYIERFRKKLAPPA